MAHFGLSLFVIIGLGFLIAHAYFTKGARPAVNFFLFAFIAAMEKEFNSFFGREFPVEQHPSPFSFSAGNPGFWRMVMVICGWVFVFYISWQVAEKILKRINYFKAKIFPLVLFAGLVGASLAYAIECAATSLGWWEWAFKDTRLSSLFVGKTHLFSLQAWFYFTVHFLAAYCLIECSKFKNSSWKAAFFLVYLARIYLILFFYSFLPREIEEYLALAALFLLAFGCPLYFERQQIYPDASPKKTIFFEKSLAVIISAVGFILLILDLFVLKQAVLLFSLLPLFFCLALAYRMNFRLLLLSGMFFLVLGREKAVLGLIPLLFFGLFYLISNLYSSSGIKKAYA